MKTKKVLTLFTSLLLTFLSVSLISINAKSEKVDALSTFTTSSNDYSSNKTGDTLKGFLHDTMVEKHRYYTTYDDLKTSSIVSTTDYYNSSNLRCFYTQGPLTNVWEGGNATGEWNREHVWPKSLSNGLWNEVSNTDQNGGTDIHHIRPIEQTLNSARSNDVFGEVTHSSSNCIYAKNKNKEYITSYPAGWDADNVFEPIDESKGDVARILMYLYVHYNKASNVSGSTDNSCPTGTLSITSVVGKSNENSCWDLLLKWNEIDQVDSVEMARNEACAKITGVRNPFIDFPNYANRIWGDGTDGNLGSTPTVEPETVNVKSINTILNDTKADAMQKYVFTSYLKVTSWSGTNTNGTQYGNMTVTDSYDNSISIYGASANKNIIAWNGTSYVYNTQTDFLTNTLTSSIVIGSKIYGEVIRTTYNGTKQLHAYITKVVNDSTPTPPEDEDVEEPIVPLPSGTTGTMVINESYSYSNINSLKTGKYIFATRVDTGYYILDPGLVTAKKTYTGVFTTSLSNYASYYFTVTRSNNIATIYADGPGSKPSRTYYYLGSNSSTSFTYSSSPYNWSVGQSYYSFGQYNAQCIQFHDATNNRNLHFKADTMYYGCYSASNYDNELYACPYLYEVDTAYNYLIEKLTGMSCDNMANTTFHNRLTYLFNKLSLEEVNTLKTKYVKGANGVSKTAYDAYVYAISYYDNYYGASNSVLTKNNENIVLIAISVSAIISLISIILVKKRRNA